jgi:hypothetical protein
MLKLHNDEVCKTCVEPPKPVKVGQKQETKREKNDVSTYTDSNNNLRDVLGQLEDDFRILKMYYFFNAQRIS